MRRMGSKFCGVTIEQRMKNAAKLFPLYLLLHSQLHISLGCCSSYDVMIGNSKKVQAERSAFLQSNGTKLFPGIASVFIDDPRALSLMRPTIGCPFSMHKVPSVRYGSDGKWVCGLELLRPLKRPCIVYSFGSRGKMAFEKIVEHFAPHCAVYIFDPFHPPKQHQRFHLRSVPLGTDGKLSCDQSQCFHAQGLEEIMAMENHNNVDIIKMDIEGDEIDVIPSVHWCKLRTWQVLLEVHDIDRKYTISNILNLIFLPLEKCGFHLFSLEPVCNNVLPRCLRQYELSFIRFNSYVS